MRLLAFALVLGMLAGCASPDVSTSTTTSPPTSTPTAVSSSTPSQQASPTPPPRASPSCSGSGPVRFNTSPMRAEDFGTLLPYGLMVGGHVTPIDHMYFTPAEQDSLRDSYEVRAIADGVISNIGTRPSTHARGSTNESVEYRIWIDHTCTFHSYVDLVTSVTPKILAKYDPKRGLSEGIPIQAGELLGRIGGQTLDFGVYDDSAHLAFIVPEHYRREDWKVHTVDPIQYFDGPAKDLLVSRLVRQAEPRSGRIMYDVDGKLVGSWFQVGTNGYAGVNQTAYWSGHASFVYDAIVPAALVVSLGDFGGEAVQYGVKGNVPDPANVSVDTGLVRYELVRYEYVDADTGQRHARNFDKPVAHPGFEAQSNVEGVVLLQMTGPRTLKLEAFPHKSAAEVTGFDADARTYER